MFSVLEASGLEQIIPAKLTAVVRGVSGFGFRVTLTPKNLQFVKDLYEETIIRNPNKVGLGVGGRV